MAIFTASCVSRVRPIKLLPAVEDGLQAASTDYRREGAAGANRERLDKMLIEILGMVSPSASSRASRLQRYVLELATALALPPRWQWSTAAYISQIGCVTLPKEILAKVDAAQALSDEERRLYESHPEIAQKLLAAIPRLEDIAAIVRVQFGTTDFAGKPEDISQWRRAQCRRAAVAHVDRVRSPGRDAGRAVRRPRRRSGHRSSGSHRPSSKRCCRSKWPAASSLIARWDQGSRPRDDPR